VLLDGFDAVVLGAVMPSMIEDPGFGLTPASGISGHGRVSFAQGDSGFGPTGRGPVHCNPRHSPLEGRFRSTG
jgi:hypothetical protein